MTKIQAWRNCGIVIAWLHYWRILSLNLRQLKQPILNIDLDLFYKWPQNYRKLWELATEIKVWEDTQEQLQANIFKDAVTLFHKK